jgi:hypothetical protein
MNARVLQTQAPSSQDNGRTCQAGVGRGVIIDVKYHVLHGMNEVTIITMPDMPYEVVNSMKLEAS